jgi:glucose-fructose oxidoreductase
MGTPMANKRMKKIRYAVAGQGYIAQAAVLPAFENAAKNSELVALISDDPAKLRKLAKRYGVERTYDYSEYDKCLRSGDVDAVYIAPRITCIRLHGSALPGWRFMCFVKAHGTYSRECQTMIQVCRQNRRN